MKKLFAFFFGLLIMAHGAFAAVDPAIDFVNRLTDDIIENVLASDEPMEKKLGDFRAKFQAALDLKYIGQFVTGVYWRTATPDQREAFLSAFMEFATKSWADKFNMYTGQKIVFKGNRNAQKDQYFVDSVIQNNPPVDVVWRLREKDGAYKIVDIIVEGISMAMSYRNEYNAFLQSNNSNIETLTKTLIEKSENFQFTGSNK